MGKLKTRYFDTLEQENINGHYFQDYLSAEDFDLMLDGEYEVWKQRQEQLMEQFLAEKAAYEEALSLAK